MNRVLCCLPKTNRFESVETRPGFYTADNVLGCEEHLNVRIANVMVSRMCYLTKIGLSKLIVFWAPRIAAFWAPSAKPTRLYSNCLLILAKLRRTLTKVEKQRLGLDSTHLVTVEFRDSKLKVTGKVGDGALKSSQEYTGEYARTCLDAYYSNCARHAPSLSSILAGSSDSD